MQVKIEGHPRIHVDAEALKQLKSKAKTTHAFYYAKLMEAAREIASQKLPGKFGTGVDNRHFGDELPVLAMAYLLGGDEKYLDFARRILTRLLACEKWGDDLDLVTGHFIGGAAIAYDWLYGVLSSAEREAIAAKLARHAEILYSYASKERIWWHDYFLHNWNYVITGGLAYAAAALAGEHPATGDWSDYAQGMFGKAQKALPEDGSYQEGFAYMTYGWECLVRYFDLARQLYGRDHFGAKWLREAPYLLLYFSTPEPRWHDNCMMFGDGPRHFEWHGPVHLLHRSAAEYRDGIVQGFAKYLVDKGVGLTRTGTWLNMLWYDPSVGPSGHDHLPTMRLFGDLDVASARSGWDDDAVMVGFKCSNNAGRKTMRECPGRDLGSGHAHPDAASFQMYAFGEWLAVDTGYTHFKQSRDHNTILVNGVGQLGGERIWFDVMECFSNGGNCEITHAESTREYDYMRADAAGIYRPQAGLARFVRHVIFLKPCDVVVIDELTGKAPSAFQWRLHADKKIDGRGAKFTVKKGKARLAVTFLAAGDLKTSVERVSIDAHAPAGMTKAWVLSASPRKRVRKTLFVAFMSAYKGKAPDSSVLKASAAAGRVRLAVRRAGATKTVTLDVRDNKVTIA